MLDFLESYVRIYNSNTRNHVFEEVYFRLGKSSEKFREHGYYLEKGGRKFI